MKCVLWVAGSVEAAHLLLDEAISLGDALILAQMLHPAFDQKGLDDAPLLRGIFKHAPGIGAVAAPPMLEARQRVEKRFAVGGDAIFDGDQHRAAIVFDRLRGHGHDTRAIQAYLGHRSIMSTVRYTALTPNRFKNFWKD